MKLFGLRIIAPERGGGGRTFQVNAKEGHVGAKKSNFTLDGNVELKASDGLTARTEHATYAESDGIVRTPGPASFTRGRVSGDGTGMTTTTPTTSSGSTPTRTCESVRMRKARGERTFGRGLRDSRGKNSTSSSSSR